MHGTKQVGFAGSWGTTALINTPNSTFFTENYGTSRYGGFIGVMPNLDAVYSGD
jgi:hypothetical protein